MANLRIYVGTLRLEKWSKGGLFWTYPVPVDTHPIDVMYRGKYTIPVWLRENEIKRHGEPCLLISQ